MVIKHFKRKSFLVGITFHGVIQFKINIWLESKGGLCKMRVYKRGIKIEFQ